MTYNSKVFEIYITITLNYLLIDLSSNVDTLTLLLRIEANIIFYLCV